MRIQPFESSETDYGGTEILEPLARKFLHGHLPHELVYAKAAVGSGKAVGWQDMIRAAAIVANRFRCSGPDEYGAGIAYLRKSFARLRDLQDQVFRGIEVADLNSRAHVVNHNDTRILEGATRDIGA